METYPVNIETEDSNVLSTITVSRDRCSAVVVIPATELGRSPKKLVVKAHPERIKSILSEIHCRYPAIESLSIGILKLIGFTEVKEPKKITVCKSFEVCIELELTEGDVSEEQLYKEIDVNIDVEGIDGFLALSSAEIKSIRGTKKTLISSDNQPKSRK